MFGKDNVLRFPKFERTLAGITAQQVFRFAEELVKEGFLSSVRFDDIPKEAAYNAKEILLTGTTIEIVPVVKYDNHIIGHGKAGEIFKRLLNMLRKDMGA